MKNGRHPLLGCAAWVLLACGDSSPAEPGPAGPGGSGFAPDAASGSGAGSSATGSGGQGGGGSSQGGAFGASSGSSASSAGGGAADLDPLPVDPGAPPAPSGDYNFGDMTHNAAVAKVKAGGVPLRDGSARPMGSLRVENGTHPAGTGSVYIQATEKFTTANPEDGIKYTLWYTWGNGSDPRHESGFIWIKDMVDGEGPKPGPFETQNGKFAKFRLRPDGSKVAWRIQTAPIDDLYFCGPTDKRSRSFQDYGQPKADAGSNEPDFTHVVWSWVNRKGGGITRDVVKTGDTFYPANVEPITSEAMTPESPGVAEKCATKPPPASAQPGWVRAVYGALWRGDRWSFGWCAAEHKRGDEAPVRHYVVTN